MFWRFGNKFNTEIIINPNTKIIALSDIHADMDAFIIALEDCGQVIKNNIIGELSHPSFNNLKRLSENNISDEIMNFKKLKGTEYLERQLLLDLNDTNSFDTFDQTLGFSWVGGNTHVVLVGDILDGKRGSVTKKDRQNRTLFLNQYPQLEVKLINFINYLDHEARKVEGRVIKLMGNHEHINVSLDDNYRNNNIRYSFSNYSDNPEEPNYYQGLSRTDYFKIGNPGFDLLKKGGIGLILKINNNIFVHGQIQEKSGGIKRNLTFYKDVNNWINDLPDSINDRNHPSLTSRQYFVNDINQDKSILWAREYGSIGDREGINICDKINRDVAAFCSGSTCNALYPEDTIKIIVGHCPNYMYNNPNNKTFKYFLQNSPTSERGDETGPVYKGSPDFKNNNVYGISMECGHDDSINDSKLFKVDIGMSRAFDDRELNGILSIPDPRKYLNDFNNYVSTRIPQVLEIIGMKYNIIKSTHNNTLLSLPRPNFYNNVVNNMTISNQLKTNSPLAFRNTQVMSINMEITGNNALAVNERRQILELPEKKVYMKLFEIHINLEHSSSNIFRNSDLINIIQTNFKEMMSTNTHTQLYLQKNKEYIVDNAKNWCRLYNINLINEAEYACFKRVILDYILSKINVTIIHVNKVTTPTNDFNYITYYENKNELFAIPEKYYNLDKLDFCIDILNLSEIQNYNPDFYRQLTTLIPFTYENISNNIRSKIRETNLGNFNNVFLDLNLKNDVHNLMIDYN